MLSWAISLKVCAHGHGDSAKTYFPSFNDEFYAALNQFMCFQRSCYHCCLAAAETWRRVWGDGKFYHRPTFLNDVLGGKNFHFHVQIFWWLFFSHRPGFSDFDSLSSDSPYLYCAPTGKMTLSSQGKALFKKRIPWRHLFFYSVWPFAPIPQHYFSKYWGDQCMGRPPPQILGGPSPIGLCPCCLESAYL